MADFNNPTSMSELRSIYGTGPEAFMEGDRQQNLARQYQEDSFRKQQELTKQVGLETLFQEQNNPTRVKQAEANLQGTLYDNTSKGVKSRLDVATEPFKLDDAKRAQALAMPEHEIKMMQAKGEQWAMSDDPAQAAKGQAILQKSRAAIEARQKHKDEMEKQELIRASAERVAAGNNAATRYSADTRAKTAAGRKQIASTVDQALLTAKSADQRAGLYDQGARQAMMSGDNELAQYYAQQAQKERAAIQNKAEGAARVAAGVKPNLPSMGIETNQSVAEKKAPVAVPPVAVPNDKHIAALKANPNAAAMFDAKFGPGAAAKYLGK